MCSLLFKDYAKIITVMARGLIAFAKRADF
jgi:hypothetical protein